jgi:hypothetical protein
MKRLTWMGLPLALILGCHHNLHAPPHGGMMDLAGMHRRFPNTRSQIAFVNPVGMKVGWETSVGGSTRTFVPAQLTTPGRYNFDQAAIYRLKLTDVPGYQVPFYPTLEVAPSTPRTDAYLTHNAIPVEFTDEDFDQVSAGNFVTKVIYLPDPQHQELAIAGVETLVSTRLDPGVDPIAEADRRGTILAIVRLGGIDLEMVQGPPLGPQSGGPGTMMMAADPSDQVVLQPHVLAEQVEMPAEAVIRH